MHATAVPQAQLLRRGCNDMCVATWHREALGYRLAQGGCVSMIVDMLRLPYSLETDIHTGR